MMRTRSTARTIFFFVVLFTGISMHAAGERGFVIYNREDAVLFFAPEYLVRKMPPVLTASRERLAALLTEGTHPLQSVPPGAAISVTPFPDRHGMFVGFYFSEDSGIYPLVVLEADPVMNHGFLSVGKTNIAKDRAGRTIFLRADESGFTPPPVIVDNRFLDWLDITDTAKFPAGWTPENCERQLAGRRVSVPIERSLYWDRGGTDVDRVKLIRAGSTLYFMISSFSRITEGVSYTFYLMNGNEPLGSIEIPVTGTAGTVVGWSNASSLPQPAGAYTHGLFYLEGFVDLEDVSSLGNALSEPDENGGEFIFTSGFSENDVFEEFVMTSFRTRDIPRSSTVPSIGNGKNGGPR